MPQGPVLAVAALRPRGNDEGALLREFELGPFPYQDGWGWLYRAFARVAPAGGPVRRAVCRWFYPSALDFYYRACVFEALHLPFFITLVVLAVHRASIGRVDLALENTAINVLVNVYPMMHHRRTRARIVELLDRRLAATQPPTSTGNPWHAVCPGLLSSRRGNGLVDGGLPQSAALIHESIGFPRPLRPRG